MFKYARVTTEMARNQMTVYNYTMRLNVCAHDTLSVSYVVRNVNTSENWRLRLFHTRTATEQYLTLKLKPSGHKIQMSQLLL